MKVNLETEKLFITLIKDGKISVDENGTVFNNLTGNELGKRPTSKGYKSIGYKLNGKVYHQLVHRLVHILYNDGFTESQPICNHKDGNKWNNHFSNLEKCSFSENLKHAIDNDLKNMENFLSYEKPKGEKTYSAKISDDQALQLRKEYATGKFSHRKLAEKYGISHPNIGRIIRGDKYKHLPLTELL